MLHAGLIQHLAAQVWVSEICDISLDDMHSTHRVHVAGVGLHSRRGRALTGRHALVQEEQGAPPHPRP